MIPIIRDSIRKENTFFSVAAPLSFFAPRRVSQDREAALKILLSAFACEPAKGSEFEVGWKWTVGLAELGHQVTVLTRSISRASIERAVEALPAGLTMPRFVYFDVPSVLRWEARGPLHIHYMIWQRAVVRVAQPLHARERFECVHHVTYAGLRAPSFLWRLGIPFIFGPVAGGERAPWRLRYGYSPQGFIEDALRDVANLFVQYQPAIARTFARASKIYVTSHETLRLMPRAFRSKAAIELAIGSADDMPRSRSVIDADGAARERPFRVLFAGRHIDYKGMHLGLPAFARLLVLEPQSSLTVVGDGPVNGRWRRQAARLGVLAQVTWLPWQRQIDMAAIYAEHDVFLFPALHDSGGLVVLEAMSHGLPVVCLRLGGPGVLVDDSCGCAIDVTGLSRAEVISALADAMASLADRRRRSTFANAARARCHEFSWRKKVQRVYGLVS